MTPGQSHRSADMLGGTTKRYATEWNIRVMFNYL